MTRARELSKLINTNSFSVDSDFNVGIGSTSPDVKLDVGGAVLVTGISTFENTTQSTSSTTGALIVSGGVGIAKSLNVGGNLSVAGTITYDDVTNIDSVGIITAQSGVSIADSIFHTGDTNTAIRFPAADTFTVETGGTKRFEVDSSGNVVLGFAGNNLYFQNGFNDSNARIQNGGASNNSNLKFYTRSSGTEAERLRITSVGEVRVGSAFSVSQAGVVTATEFHGDASNLTNLPASGDSNDITASLFI